MRLHRTIPAPSSQAAPRTHTRSDANPNSENEYDNTALHDAAWDGKVDVLKMLLAAGADLNHRNLCNHTPLHFAVYGGNSEAVELLLLHGANVHTQKIEGHTALDAARSCGYTKILNLLQTAAGVLPSSFPHPGEC